MAVNYPNLEESWRASYEATRASDASGESGLPANYPTWEQYRADQIRALGLPANTDLTKYSQIVDVPDDSNIRSYSIVNPNGETIWNNTYKDHGYNFLNNTVLPAALIWGGGALLGAAAGAAGAAGGAAGAGGAGAAGGAAGAGSAAGLGASGGVGAAGGLGAAGGAATLPTVVVSGTSAGGLGGLGGALAGGAGTAAGGLLGGSGDAFQQAADEALQGSGNYYQQNPAQQWWTNVSNQADAAGGGLGNYAGAIKDSLGGLSNVASGISNGSNWASLIGAGLGALDSGKGTSSSVANQIDPRMAAYLYGKGYGDPNSLLGAAQQWWSQNRSGINPTMQQGLDMQKSVLTDPAYGQAYTQMRSVGNGLLGAGVAGNPFLTGQSSLPSAPAGGQNAFAGGGLLNPIELQAKGRGLLVM